MEAIKVAGGLAEGVLAVEKHFIFKILKVDPSAVYTAGYFLPHHAVMGKGDFCRGDRSIHADPHGVRCVFGYGTPGECPESEYVVPFGKVAEVHRDVGSGSACAFGGLFAVKESLPSDLAGKGLRTDSGRRKGQYE